MNESLRVQFSMHLTPIPTKEAKEGGPILPWYLSLPFGRRNEPKIESPFYHAFDSITNERRQRLKTHDIYPYLLEDE